MSLNGSAAIVGACEHPTRMADSQSVLRLHADVDKGALADAGPTRDDIDGYFCAGDAPGPGTATVAEYLGLKLSPLDSTDCGGLCDKHPANRGGITKASEAVRQWRGEAHPAVQVPGCMLAPAGGIGGALASRDTAATLILERV